MNHLNNKKQKTSVLWFSMKRMSKYQFDAMRKKYGYLEINQISKVVDNISEIQTEILNSDVVATSTRKLERDFFEMCQKNEKPFLRWKRFNPNNKNSNGTWMSVILKNNESLSNDTDSDDNEETNFSQPKEPKNFSYYLKKIFSGLGLLISSFTTKRSM
ncbi:MAG TPA: hypothetical protein PLQ81_15055, partial [bacterium]|nr:hypothetical protein [bacterium]